MIVKSGLHGSDGTPVISGFSVGDTIATPISTQAPDTLRDLMTAVRGASTRPSVLPRLEAGAGESRIVVEGRPRYEEVKPLGAGAVGEVMLAMDNDIGRHVAVKQLLPHVTSPSELLRFAEEIRTVGSLEHPNITPIHDVGVDSNGRYYFVMKHVQGETLADLIDRLAAGDAATHAKYTFEARTRLFRGVLQALAFAHGKGIIHRDVKPANVMIGDCGEVMLMDWGLAKRVGVAGERPDSIIGTPAYMAPEQARGDVEQLDERSDIYSASTLFYELLTLRHYLSNQETMIATLSGVQNHDALAARFVSSPHQTNVPPELSWFIAKGMKKSPADRYQSTRDMIAALEAIQRGDIRVQCPRTALKRAVHHGLRFSDAHAVSALIGVAVTVLLVALGAWKSVAYVISLFQ